MTVLDVRTQQRHQAQMAVTAAQATLGTADSDLVAARGDARDRHRRPGRPAAGAGQDRGVGFATALLPADVNQLELDLESNLREQQPARAALLDARGGGPAHCGQAAGGRHGRTGQGRPHHGGGGAGHGHRRRRGGHGLEGDARFPGARRRQGDRCQPGHDRPRRRRRRQARVLVGTGRPARPRPLPLAGPRRVRPRSWSTPSTGPRPRRTPCARRSRRRPANWPRSSPPRPRPALPCAGPPRTAVRQLAWALTTVGAVAAGAGAPTTAERQRIVVGLLRRPIRRRTRKRSTTR